MPLQIFHRPEYDLITEGFDTFVKAGAVAEAIADMDPDTTDTTVELVPPTPATDGELAAVHGHDYLEALATGEPRDLAESNGLPWDPELLPTVAASTGGVRDAALTAWRTGAHTGSLSSGLHHAGVGGGAGFCTVNGLVVAARAVLDAGAGRVLVLDLDAHCGGGTAGLIDGIDGIEAVDVSVIGYDRYESRPDARLTLVAEPADYLPSIELALDSIDAPDGIDVVLYNAGMDPHEHAGGVRGITTQVLRDRERLVFEWAARVGVPVAFVLAGGYRSARFDLDDVARLHLLTVRAAARDAPATGGRSVERAGG